MSNIIREIYLVRHGETDYNRNGVVQGRGVNSILNETGRKQAQAFYEHFKHLKFDALFASTLQRTQQTLEPFIENGHELIIHEELDEINWGIHEGKMTNRDMHNDYHRIVKQWRAGVLDEKTPGGESPAELQQRQLRFINNILPNYSGTLLICSHGRAIRSMLCTMLGKSLAEMDTFPHTNLSLYKLTQDEKGFNMEWFNYTQHLKSLK